MLPVPPVKRPPRVKTYTILLCLNDADNGLPTGRLRAVNICAAEDIRLEGPLTVSDDARILPVCRLEEGPRRPAWVQIGRRRFPICGHTSWIGNWCWDAICVTRPVLEAIVLHLHKLGKFTLDTVPHAIWEAWEGDGSALPAALAEIFGPVSKAQEGS